MLALEPKASVGRWRFVHLLLACFLKGGFRPPMCYPLNDYTQARRQWYPLAALEKIVRRGVVLLRFACWRGVVKATFAFGRLVAVQRASRLLCVFRRPGSGAWAGLVARLLGLGRPRYRRNGRQAGLLTESTLYTGSARRHKIGSPPPSAHAPPS